MTGSPKIAPCDIALVVQGRFHGFDLARTLIAKGTSVAVFTNYPRFVATRFGLPAESLVTCPMHGILHRYSNRWNLIQRFPKLEILLHTHFSKWSAPRVIRRRPKVAHVFSGVALELFQHLQARLPGTSRFLVRGSAHIREQHRLLRQESQRAGRPIELPSTWMIHREMQEYRLADRVFTLSSFAFDSFVKKGYTQDHLAQLPLGSDVAHFRPSREALEQRLRRIQEGAPLHAISAGTACLRKGVLDLIEIARALQGKVHFRWVGGVAEDAADLARDAAELIDFVPRVPQADLKRFYDVSDCFILPTIEDGFAVVLEQAKAACLPILASTHCAAPDLIEENINGRVFPIHDTAAYIAQFNRWSENRGELVSAIESLWNHPKQRDWADVAEDFLFLIEEMKNNRHPQPA